MKCRELSLFEVFPLGLLNHAKMSRFWQAGEVDRCVSLPPVIRMDRYWLAQDGQTTGPFSEKVLVEMWDHGKMQRDAQVCLEGTEDWIDGPFLVSAITDERARALSRASMPSPVRQTEVPRKKGKNAANVCFAAALLAGFVMVLAVRGSGPVDETALMVAMMMGLILVVLGLALFMQTAFVRGLLVIVFVVLMAMALKSRMDWERTIRESKEFNEKMRRLLGP